MTRNFVLSAICCSVLISSCTAQIITVPAWYKKIRTIKILETKRDALEKLFGYPKITYIDKSDYSDSVEYKIKDGELSASYSTGPCKDKNIVGYDVEKDIIIDFEITLRMKNAVTIDDLGLDFTGFDRSEIYDLPGIFEYRNDVIGEYYQTREYGNLPKSVQKISYYPKTEQEKLQCSKR